MVGYWLMLLAILAWALPPNLSRPAIREGLPPLAATVLTTVVAMPLGYLIIRALGRRAAFRRFTPRSLAYLGLTGVFSTGGFSCMYAALATETVGKAKVGKVNVDEEPRVAGLFSVQSIPTLVLVQGREVVAAMAGAAPKAALVQALRLDELAGPKVA